jgi:hypothetical protein
MTDERKPIGYLMGLPIYEGDESPDPCGLALGELTNESAKSFMEKLAADSLCRDMPNPKEDVQC